ncbi:MAG: hypothetical protein ACHQUC_03095 [Chlamydiales bacterium]
MMMISKVSFGDRPQIYSAPLNNHQDDPATRSIGSHPLVPISKTAKRVMVPVKSVFEDLKDIVAKIGDGTLLVLILAKIKAIAIAVFEFISSGFGWQQQGPNRPLVRLRIPDRPLTIGSALPSSSLANNVASIPPPVTTYREASSHTPLLFSGQKNAARLTPKREKFEYKIPTRQAKLDAQFSPNQKDTKLSALSDPTSQSKPSSVPPNGPDHPLSLNRLSIKNPISMIPEGYLIKHQESSSTRPRFWPKDLSLLGITPEQKLRIDEHIRNLFRFSGIINKKMISYTLPDQGITTQARLPIHLTVIKVGNVEQIILLPKTIFAEGGERKIRWAYNLHTGTYLIKKRVTGGFEIRIVRAVINWRNSRRGTNDLCIERTVDLSSRKPQAQPKVQLIEPVRDGVVSILFGTTPFNEFTTKRDIVVDLLNELKFLHNMSVEDASYTFNLFGRRQTRQLNYGIFHGDITISNTLVVQQNGKWHAEFCDFGSVTANPLCKSFTIGYTPPEYVRLYKQLAPEGINQRRGNPFMKSDMLLLGPSSMYRFNEMEMLLIDMDKHKLIDFNMENAQMRDIWSLGLVILSILVGRTDQMNQNNLKQNMRIAAKIAPLPCLKKCLDAINCDPYIESGILSLTQEEIDKDLVFLEQEVIAMHPNETEMVHRLFHAVGNMLKLDPKARKKASDLCALTSS